VRIRFLEAQKCQGYAYGGYGGYSMHLPHTANTTKKSITDVILYNSLTRRQLDKPLSGMEGWERRHYSNHIEQGGALVYRQIQQLFHFLEASQN
jgi:hypothetical protein